MKYKYAGQECEILSYGPGKQTAFIQMPDKTRRSVAVATLEKVESEPVYEPEPVDEETSEKKKYKKEKKSFSFSSDE